jgi:transcriptional regulator with XRE-family HTH domain
VLLGGFMRQIRLKSGLSQNEVTDRLGFPQSFLSKVERGERQLQVVEFILICRILGLEPSTTLKGYVDELPAISTLAEPKRVRRLRMDQ